MVGSGAVCAAAAEATQAPEAPSVEDGKSPASNVVEMARIRADIASYGLAIDDKLSALAVVVPCHLLDGCARHIPDLVLTFSGNPD